MEIKKYKVEVTFNEIENKKNVDWETTIFASNQVEAMARAMVACYQDNPSDSDIACVAMHKLYDITDEDVKNLVNELYETVTDIFSYNESIEEDEISFDDLFNEADYQNENNNDYELDEDNSEDWEALFSGDIEWDTIEDYKTN